MDNSSYYLLTPDRRHYVDDTGCGNTMRTGHPGARVLVLESLRFWARTMGVDGFRFDLASIFSRAADGTMNVHEASMVSEISLLGHLFDVRLVAEAWDIGSYQLGRGFPGIGWLQWNGKFRDDVRAFVRGEPGKVGALMQRIYGSDDLFPDGLDETCRPYQSVNFVTAHDGFCLYDLVAYDRKHNEANGHGNTDGTDDNRSWNCGAEGDANAPPAVLALRRQQAKNVCALLMLANGIPMIVAGDEFLNTQRGNNNPYNQDNDITWLDWSRLEDNRDVFRFFKLMIAFRKSHAGIGRPVFWRDDVTWYGADGPVDLGARIAVRRLLTEWRLGRRWRSLRDDERALERSRLYGARRAGPPMAPRRRYVPAQPGRHRRTGKRTSRWRRRVTRCEPDPSWFCAASVCERAFRPVPGTGRPASGSPARMVNGKDHQTG